MNYVFTVEEEPNGDCALRVTPRLSPGELSQAPAERILRLSVLKWATIFQHYLVHDDCIGVWDGEDLTCACCVACRGGRADDDCAGCPIITLGRGKPYCDATPYGAYHWGVVYGSCSPDELAALAFDELCFLWNVYLESRRASTIVHFYADGGCRNNGQDGAEAYWSFAAHAAGITTHHRQGTVAAHLPQTNNVAEYTALIECLRFVIGNNYNAIVHTDSALVYGQLCLGWAVRAEHLKPMHKVAATWLERSGAQLRRVPREDIVAVLGH